MVKFLYFIGLSALTLPLWSAETITLKTGYSLVADRHELSDGNIRIFARDEVTEMPASLISNIEIAGVEAIPDPPKPERPAPPPAPAQPSTQKQPETPYELARAAAQKYSLPDAFVASVMRAESGFNPAAISSKGAIGLMQLMPATAHDLGADPKDPSQNADAGAHYLRDLLARYEDQPDQVELALAAYNAGPAAVDKYHGVPPYRETREYILRVLKTWNPPPAEPASKEAAK
jgi:soluble lytic murein transglycosylase-like protein